MYYAQINVDGICIGVSQLAGKVETEHMIEIDEYDTSLLGKRWSGETWDAGPDPEPGPPPETIEDKMARLEEQNLILMDALATTFEEVLALRAIVEGGTV